MVYKRESIINFGKYKGKTIEQISKINPSYLEWLTANIEGFTIEKGEELLKVERKVLTKNYCYKGYIDDFLERSKSEWLLEMKNNFNEAYDLELGEKQINAWEDCFYNLHKYLVGLREKRYYLIFEYRLPYEGGRRPDLIILSENTVCILEFKMKSIIEQADLDQVLAYTRDIREYHYESRHKKIIPILVPTGMSNSSSELNGVRICSANNLSSILKSYLGDEIKFDPIKWLDSKYEPLPTIVDAAKMFMNNEELPNIKKVNSTGIPEAIKFLQDITNKAKANKEHVLALVTGVPGAGKTFLGLNFVYNKNERSDNVNSVYLSGNGPLIKVLTDELQSKVFVKDLHREMDEFFKKGNKDFNKNIIVFDEGQRVWNEERIKNRYSFAGKTEADMMIEMIDEKTEWSILIVLVGEGQEINTGETNDIKQWNKAIKSSKNNWKVVCPNKLESNFSTDNIINYECRDLLDLTVSLRSHLAGDVSNFINNIISGEFEEASQLVKKIYEQGFSMVVTRDLEKAKEYCNKRYNEQDTKRYGLMASSKAKNLRGYVDNSYNATKEVNVGWWYNRAKGERGSCCNLEDVVTEFACQGLEVDMPIICWGNDMKLVNSKWQRHIEAKDTESLNNLYRINSYRVLLTRGRDGFIIFIPPNSNELDEVYDVFASTLGLKVI